MFLRKLAPAIAALLLCVSIAPPAAAESAEELARARELFVEGARLAEAGKWEAARERFERSLALKKAALTYYNLGVAQQESGRVADAIESFRAFLASPVEPATQAYVAPVRAVLPELEARVAHVGVEVRPAGIAGTVVRIDGREVPAAGAHMVDPGKHDVVVSAPGYFEAKHTASVGPGARASVMVQLTPLGPSSAVPLGLGIGGLVMLVGGEVVFALGAAQDLDFAAKRGPAKAMMIAGNAIAGAGAITAGIGLVMMLRRPSAPKSAALAPWSNGAASGLELRF